MTLYWIAHVRGADFNRLEEEGFITLYPTMDDYVFLVETEENKKYVRRQSELGIFFLKSKKGLRKITQAELDVMKGQTRDKIEIGCEINIVSGYCAHLNGSVIGQEKGKIRCLLKGYNRSYDVWVEDADVVLRKEENEIGNSPFN